MPHLFATRPADAAVRRPCLPLWTLLPVAAALIAAAPGAARAGGDAHKGAAATAPAAAAKPAAAPDNLELLRERLAEKLGAVKPPEARNGGLVRVVAKLDAPTPAAASSSAPAARPPSAPKKAAPGDGHSAAPGPAAAAAPAKSHGHWSYAGETGPQAWGGLKPEFGLCASGKRQSPIDIRGGFAVDLDPVQFDYRASGFAVIDNGHTVQVNVGTGNSIQALGRRYELVQFHFHRPSEERIDGRQHDMSVHLVHKDPEGRLAVVAVLLERGAAQPVLQQVWNNLPLEKGEEQAAGSVIDLNHLLPADRGYMTYMGSLTTPPCSEGVLWMVMRQPVTLSQGQLDIFARMYPMNARPVQSTAGRMIKQSQ